MTVTTVEGEEEEEDCCVDGIIVKLINCRRRRWLLYDCGSVSQYVLVSSTLVGLATRYYFLSDSSCLKYAVLFLWGALSDEWTGLQFAV
jgi:hypothetical protein